MANLIQNAVGTTAECNAANLPAGVLGFDTSRNELRVYNSSTVGGVRLANADLSNVRNPNFSTSTGSLAVPVGNTSQRTSNAPAGSLRWNNQLRRLEVATNSTGTWEEVGSGTSSPASTNVVLPTTARPGGQQTGYMRFNPAGYPEIGLQTAGTWGRILLAGSTFNATTATNATRASIADRAITADSASSATTATRATTADSATSASRATIADTATRALTADAGNGTAGFRLPTGNDGARNVNAAVGTIRMSTTGTPRPEVATTTGTFVRFLLAGDVSSSSSSVIGGTEGLTLPRGSNSQRPSPVANPGVIRFNTDRNVLEVSTTSSGAWADVLTTGVKVATAALADRALRADTATSATSASRAVSATNADRATEAVVALDSTGTDTFQLPSGGDSQRGNATAGGVRYNTGSGKFEGRFASGFKTFATTDELPAANRLVASLTGVSSGSVFTARNGVARWEVPTSSTPTSVGSLPYIFNGSSPILSGNGKVYFNSTIPGSITQIILTRRDRNGSDREDRMVQWDDSTNPGHKGTLYIFADDLDQSGNADRHISFAVTRVVGSSSNVVIDVDRTQTITNTGSPFNTNQNIRLSFSRTGNKGADGTGTGSGGLTQADITETRTNSVSAALYTYTKGTNVRSSGTLAFNGNITNATMVRFNLTPRTGSNLAGTLASLGTNFYMRFSANDIVSVYRVTSEVDVGADRGTFRNYNVSRISTTGSRIPGAGETIRVEFSDVQTFTTGGTTTTTVSRLLPTRAANRNVPVWNERLERWENGNVLSRINTRNSIPTGTDFDRLEEGEKFFNTSDFREYVKIGTSLYRSAAFTRVTT